MRNLDEWRIDSLIDQELNELDMLRANRALDGSGTIQRYDASYFTLLARHINRITMNRLAQAEKKDPSVADDDRKQNEIKQEILRDIIALASNVIVNGMKSSHTSTNFGKIGTNLRTDRS